MKSERKNLRFQRFKTKILDFFFPRHIKCVFCGEELKENSRYDCCEKCKEKLPFITFSCARCGGTIPADSSGVCLDCKRHEYSFDFARAVFDYEGEVVALIHKFKFHGQKFLCEPLGNYLCDRLATWEVKPDIITYVPMHPKREKERGYNQAKLLAEFVANKFDLPCLCLVEKAKETASQTTLAYDERQTNLVDSFKFNRQFAADVKGKSVLIIDDIFTTGATMNEMARVIKAHGTKEINALTVAHTKLKTGENASQ